MNIESFINRNRVFPRILLFSFLYMWYESSVWFMGLEDPSNAQSIYISAVWGSLGLFSNWYMNGDKKGGQ